MPKTEPVILTNMCFIQDDQGRFVMQIRSPERYAWSGAAFPGGYVEDWKFYKTYSGTPQGGIISPILANIYLDNFDKYMTDYVKNFCGGKYRKRTPEYRQNEIALGKSRRTLVYVKRFIQIQRTLSAVFRPFQILDSYLIRYVRHRIRQGREANQFSF